LIKRNTSKKGVNKSCKNIKKTILNVAKNEGLQVIEEKENIFIEGWGFGQKNVESGNSIAGIA
jgi:hypothetical protein